MYRCHPQTLDAPQLLAESIVGEVRLIESVFGGRVASRPEEIREINAFGGGAILDLGSYRTSMARLLAGAECIGMVAQGDVGASRVDTRAVGVARFANGVLAVLICARDADLGSRASICGSRGTLHLADPWIPGEPASIELSDANHRRRIVEYRADRSVYTPEADVVAARLVEREAPEMTWSATLENARMLDDWRASIGLVFEGELDQGES